MALSIALSSLVAQCQQRANKLATDDGQIQAPEWKQVISEHYGRMHGVVVDAGAGLFDTEATINLANLAVPADHHSTIGVDFVVDSAGTRRELDEMVTRTQYSGLTGEARAWALVGSSLRLAPMPSTGTYKHIYVTQPTSYASSSDGTAVDVITNDGLEFILWGVASVALHRAESAQQRAMGEAERALLSLKAWAVERAKQVPKRTRHHSLNPNYRSIHGAWNPASWRYR